MTTLIPFSPSINTSFVQQVTLDGNPYTLVVTWNLWGYAVGNAGAKRPYLTILDQSGNVVICTAMVASPLGYDIDLLPAALGFSDGIVYRIDNGNIEIGPVTISTSPIWVPPAAPSPPAFSGLLSDAGNPLLADSGSPLEPGE